MNRIVFLVGPSGAGKTTLERELEDNFGFKRAISTTTRLPREGEKNGKAYHFVTPETFKEMEEDGWLVESVTFAGNKYGLSKDELAGEQDLVIVAEPHGVKILNEFLAANEPHKTRFTVLFMLPETQRVQNMQTRGESMDTITERLKKDNILKEFQKLGLEADFFITQQNPVRVTAEVLIERIRRASYEAGQ